MKKRNVGDGKDKYRKKDYTPLYKRNLGQEYQDFIMEFKMLPAEPPGERMQFIFDKFGLISIDGIEKNSDLKVIVLCQDETLREMLIDLGNKGANLKKIMETIKLPPDVDSGDFSMHPEIVEFLKPGIQLNPSYNDLIESYENKRRAYKRKVKAIKNAVNLLINLPDMEKEVDGLPMHYSEFNKRLSILRDDIREVVDLYIKYIPSFDCDFGKITGDVSQKWTTPLHKLMKSEGRKVSQSSRIWNDMIITLVDEIRRIGFSDRQSYIKTATFLNYCYPQLYTDTDPDRVRQRYTYHKNKQK